MFVAPNRKRGSKRESEKSKLHILINKKERFRFVALVVVVVVNVSTLVFLLYLHGELTWLVLHSSWILMIYTVYCCPSFTVVRP